MFETDEDRDPLEVLADEFVERQRRGEHPSIMEYVARRPDLAADIEELFPTVAVVERLKVEKEQHSGTRVSLGTVRPERVGDFRLLGEIGRGGMGIVYEAFQESLGRRVAVKVLPKQTLLDNENLRRFQREAQTAAKLHHTNIVPVFGVGEHEGFHFIVMQLIRGQGLDAFLAGLRQAAEGSADAQQDERDLAPVPPPSSRPNGVSPAATSLRAGPPPSAEIATDRYSVGHDTKVGGWPDPASEPPPAAPTLVEGGPFGADHWHHVASIGRQVAEALHYAHSHHTLHRDIKPANLLLDPQGVAWVTDFGLAKAMDQDNVTQTGVMAGTLPYMAPEQFAGQVDARSDIYSLGLTLYELLTLRPAFADGSRSSLIGRITRDEPIRPRAINPDIPHDLETIVLKATAREPRDRYQTGGEFAHDLNCFLEDRPIQARRVSSFERLWRWARREPAVAGLAASTLLLLVVVAVVASVGFVLTARAHAQERQANVKERRQRKKAEDTTALAIEALDSMFRQLAPDRTAPASAALVVGAEGLTTVPVQPVLSKEVAAMLEHMLTFYDRLAAEGDGDAKLRRKTAEANRRIGDIHQRLGHYEQARVAYLGAIELYTRLAESSAEETELRVEIARIHNELGNVCDAASQAGEGRKSHLNALAALEAASAESAASPRWRYELARTYYLLGKRTAELPGPPPRRPDSPCPPEGSPPGFVFDPRGRRHEPRPPFPRQAGPEDEERLDDVLALWQQLAQDDPDRPPPGPGDPQERRPAPPRPQPSSPPPSLGSDRKENEDYRRKAVKLLEGLVADHPTVPDYRHLLARCYREMPPEPDLTPKSESRSFHGAARILEELVDEHPDVADYRYDLSETYAMLGDRRPQEPEVPDENAAQRSPAILLERALAIAGQLVAEHPNIPDYAVSLVNIRLRLHHRLRAIDPARAEANLREALDVQSALARRFPDNSSCKFWMAAVQESLGALLQEQGRVHEASSVLQDCVASYQDVLQDDVTSARARDVLVKNYMNLADVLRRTGQEQAAREAQRQAEDLRPER